MRTILKFKEEGGIEYTIRLAQDIDFEHIFKIWYDNQTYAKEWPIYSDVAQLKLKFLELFNKQNDNFKFWVAESNGLILGYQSISRAQSNPILEEETAESSTYVLDAYRSKKIGYNLILCCMDYLPYTNIKILQGKISESNLKAIAMAESLGWNFVGRIPQTIRKPYTVAFLLFVYNVPELTQVSE